MSEWNTSVEWTDIMDGKEKLRDALCTAELQWQRM